MTQQHLHGTLTDMQGAFKAEALNAPGTHVAVYLGQVHSNGFSAALTHRIKFEKTSALTTLGYARFHKSLLF